MYAHERIEKGTTVCVSLENDEEEEDVETDKGELFTRHSLEDAAFEAQSTRPARTTTRSTTRELFHIRER